MTFTCVLICTLHSAHANLTSSICNCVSTDTAKKNPVMAAKVKKAATENPDIAKKAFKGAVGMQMKSNAK